MGKPGFLHRALAGLLLLAGCGGGEPDLLATADVEEIYSHAAGGGGFAAISSNPADYATIVGTVRYEGRRRKHKVALAKAFCINANANGMLSEDFLVGAKGELANVVVYVKRGLHKIRFDPPAEPVLLDQKDCQYVPHLVVVQIGQPLIIKSSDHTEHNVHLMPGANPGLNKPMNAPGDLAPMTFGKTEVAKPIQCDIHAWMHSYLAVLPHPCWAITGPDGKFRIVGVPPGHLQLAAWHEELGELTLDLDLNKNEESAQDFVFPAEG